MKKIILNDVFILKQKVIETEIETEKSPNLTSNIPFDKSEETAENDEGDSSLLKYLK